MDNNKSRRNFVKQTGMGLFALTFPWEIARANFKKKQHMKEDRTYEILIIGGSYAGLSAAMALGRAMRKVLILDSGTPCNRFTPHSHNFITLDGEKPQVIAAKAKEQVLQYPTVSFENTRAVSGKKVGDWFEITTKTGVVYTAKKLIFATGVKDLLPEIKGFEAAWGKTIIHCPYCHGYEVRNVKTGIFANGEFAMHYAQLIRNWTPDLTLFTNGKSTLTLEQTEKLARFNIPLVAQKIVEFVHDEGKIKQVIFDDGSMFHLEAIYAKPPFEQQSSIPEMLGCSLTEMGLIQVDMFQKTTIPNVFAVGDSTSMMRSVAFAVNSGNIAGAVLNNLMTEEEFVG